MEYETDCGGQFPILRKRNYCNDVELGTTVDFYINITLTDYPENGVYVSLDIVEILRNKTEIYFRPIK